LKVEGLGEASLARQPPDAVLSKPPKLRPESVTVVTPTMGAQLGFNRVTSGGS